MHLIDTNYLVRLATNDDPVKREQASDFLLKCKSLSQPVYVTLTSVLECLWVLESVYS